MAIHPLLQYAALGPDDISRLVLAYHETLRALGLKQRSDAITQLVARRIIEIAQRGVRDPLQLASIAITELSAVSD
jgi:hypothetical protein